MSNNNRCANTEALGRYEKEMSANEKAYDQNCEDMFNELDEAIEMYEAIARKYELKEEAKEYMMDNL